MKVLEISPFIRFSYRMTLSPQDDVYTSLDCRLFYVHNGQGSIEIENIIHPLRQGSMFLWQPGTRYRFICEKPIEVTTINFDYTAERSEITDPFEPVLKSGKGAKVTEAEGKIKTIDFEDCPSLNKPIILQNAGSISAELETIIVEHTAKQPFYSVKISGILKKIIADAVKMNSSPALTPKATKKLDIVIEYIHNNYQENISNSILAQLVSYHPYYLNRLMLSTKGVTLHQYIINYRIGVAEKLLLSTDESISSIAVKTGFSNITCFTTNFKKKNHMTPSDFREKLSE